MRQTEKPNTSSQDWRMAVRSYPWMPTAKLKAEYGLENSSISNLEGPLKARRLSARIHAEATPSALLTGLREGWLYLLKRDLGWTLSDPKIAQKIYQLRAGIAAEHNLSFLTTSRYYQLAFPGKGAPNVRKWLDDGYTLTAFAFQHVLPELSQQLNLHPALFQGTQAKVLTSRSTTGQKAFRTELMAHIWLKHFYPDDDPVDRMTWFIDCHSYQGYVTERDFVAWGLGDRLRQGQSWKTSREDLAAEFSRQLKTMGIPYGGTDQPRWSANAYMARFPHLPLETCEICGSPSVELHHLLPQVLYPEYIYHPGNVVALCRNAHGLISNGASSADVKAMLAAAERDWLASPASLGEGRRYLFFPALQAVHAAL